MSEKLQCPFCRQSTQVETRAIDGHDIRMVAGCSCPPYVIDYRDILMHFQSDEERAEWHPERICALLWEMDYKNRPRAFLQFQQKEYPSIERSVPILVANLLTDWPDQVLQRTERSLCNLVNYSNKNEFRIGRPIIVLRTDQKNRFFFTPDKGEEQYFVDAMAKYGWIDASEDPERWKLRITPEGYARYDELNRGRANSKNPVFVATWFGGKARKEEMTQLFNKHLKVAINRTGYRAWRADTEQHNEQIMDVVHHYIRQAPFVVAELTRNNRGVYYEAGFAKGLGTDVIYCCPEKTRPHFDVTAINLVKWDTPEDLCKKLACRIRGTIGQGPYSTDELKQVGHPDLA